MPVRSTRDDLTQPGSRGPARPAQPGASAGFGGTGGLTGGQPPQEPGNNWLGSSGGNWQNAGARGYGQPQQMGGYGRPPMNFGGLMAILQNLGFGGGGYGQQMRQPQMGGYGQNPYGGGYGGQMQPYMGQIQQLAPIQQAAQYQGPLSDLMRVQGGYGQNPYGGYGSQQPMQSYLPGQSPQQNGPQRYGAQQPQMSQPADQGILRQWQQQWQQNQQPPQPQNGPQRGGPRGY